MMQPLRAMLALGLVLAVLGGAGCRRRRELPDPGIPFASSTTSAKLATFIFKEEGRYYLMTVGVNAARFHDDDGFVPFTVVLANRTTTPLRLTRESFTLVDPGSGSRYGLASLAEVRAQGGQLHDARLMDREHLMGKLSAYQESPARFFGVRRMGFGNNFEDSLVIDRIELHQFQYILDNLYFPRPEGELLGKTFEMHVNSKDLLAPLFVSFTVPEK